MSLAKLHIKAKELASLIIAVALWQIIADVIVRNSFILPSFSEVAMAFIRLSKTILLIDIYVSLLHFSLGLALGVLIGIPLGSIMGWSRTADQLFDPIIEILRPIPPIAWVPLAIVWFHLTHFSAGFIVFIGAFFPVLLNTYTGFRGIKKRIVDAAKVLGCGRSWDLIRCVALPHAFPSIMAGIRIGMGVGWMCVVAAEIFGVSESGVGYRLFQKFYFLHQTDNLIVYMIVLGIMALIIDRTFRAITDRFLLRWRVGTVIR